MNAIAPYRADWRDRAACAGSDTRQWFSSQPTAAQGICAGCRVRPECLHDALEHEAPNGVWGGLTVAQRRALPVLSGSKAAVIAELRALLGATPHNDPSPAERTDPPMSQHASADEPLKSVPPAMDAAQLPIDKLLKWGDDHADPDVQDQAARARIALHGLRQRYSTDLELTSINSEREQLEQRLAELQARQEQLAPPKKAKGKRQPVEYPAAEVRAWAAKNGVDCPAVGRVPKRVVDAWRQATGTTS
ncbi:histone-like nucleoid-structuring protein Lsr2 [Streptomyces sp. NPDC088337]|uniref:WhiB family transcriptional regulator n=1 Tax=unclassified Streptomyces TaxID=2593676 RepID=UPI003800D7CF